MRAIHATSLLGSRGKDAPRFAQMLGPDADANGDGVRSERCKERKPDPDIFTMDHDHRPEGIPIKCIRQKFSCASWQTLIPPHLPARHDCRGSSAHFTQLASGKKDRRETSHMMGGT